MIGWHLPHHLNLFRLPSSDLMRLFLSGVARKIAMTLLTLFSPLFVFETTKSFGAKENTAIILVLVYFLITLFFKLFSLKFSEDLSRKIGFKKTIWLSAVPFIIFIPSLVFASYKPALFGLAAACWGAHAGLFWWGYHGYFIKTGETGSFGQRIGEANFLETTASVLTPILGALLATYLGFQALFIFSALFMAVSLVLLGEEHDKRQRRDIRYPDVLRLINSHKSISLAYIGSYGESLLYSVAWPLFLFLFFGQIIKLGAVVSTASFVASFFAIVFGRWVDRQGERAIVSLGVPLVAVSWTLKIINKSLPTFVIADSFENFGQRMVILPLNALTYKKAWEAESAKAILFRETTMIIGGVSVLLILIACIYLGSALNVSFIIALMFSLFPLVAIARKRIHGKNE